MDMENQEEEEKEMAEEEERKEQRQEILKTLLTVHEEVLRVLNKHTVTLSNQSIPRSLTRRPVNSRGYDS